MQTVIPEEMKEASQQINSSPSKAPFNVSTQVIELEKSELNQSTQSFKPYFSFDIDKMIRNAEWQDIKPNQIIEVNL